MRSCWSWSKAKTLAERLARGPIPLDEALPIARQIAEALEAAHEQGIIHRDLKPANIKVRADGTVKVLDFGLAKALEPDRRAPTCRTSPTITTPAMTQAGVILGTAAYMAPEQAKGRAADKRSDVWAFGCVLYEMLTGRRAFEGEDVADTLAAVLRSEPDWAALPDELPPPIRTLVRRCLEKDRRQRIADISIAHFLLTEYSNVAPAGAPAVAVQRLPPWRRVAAHAGAALAGAAVVAVAGTAVWLATRPGPPRVSRLQITPPTEQAVTIVSATRDVAITPDGARIVYTGVNDTLVVRALDQLDATLMTGLGSVPHGLFVSPDSQWIGYVSDGNRILKKVQITGGPPITLASLNGGLSGATWGPDGTIVFGTTDLQTGLLRLAPGGGEPTVLTRPNRAAGEADHVWPEFLPGGQAVLFTIRGPQATSTRRRSRSSTFVPGRRRRSYRAVPMLTTCRAAIWYTARRGHCAPSPSILPDWPLSARRCQSCRKW